MWGSFLREGFEPVHVEFCQLPKDWTAFRTDVVHNDPENEGGKLDESSHLLAALADGFDHVGDIISPSVYSTVGGNCVDDLQHFQFEVATLTC